MFGSDPFGDNTFSDILAAGRPGPPDSVPLRILRLNEVPRSREALTAAFRRRVLKTHPDVATNVFDDRFNVADRASLEASKDFQEVVWARKVVQSRIPIVPSDGSGWPGSGLNPRHCDPCGTVREWDYRHPHPYTGCDECRGKRETHPRHYKNRLVQWGRWKGLCGWCRDDLAKQEARDRRLRARTNLECNQCGTEFTPGRSDARYCSDSCRQRAYRSRRATDGDLHA